MKKKNEQFQQINPVLTVFVSYSSSADFKCLVQLVFNLVFVQVRLTLRILTLLTYLLLGLFFQLCLDARARAILFCARALLERFSIAFTANGKRQAEISRLPKTREIYLVSAYILPVSHRYGASTKNNEIS